MKKPKSNKTAAKKSSASPSSSMEREAIDALIVIASAHMEQAVSKEDRRKVLLAQVAGSIAAGLVGSPSPSITTSEAMAGVAVDIAEEILTKAGISSTASAETSEDVGAAA